MSAALEYAQYVEAQKKTKSDETPIGYIAVTETGQPCGHQGGRLYRFAGTARNALYADKVYAVRLSDLKEV